MKSLIKLIKRLLGIVDLEASRKQMDEAMDIIQSQIKKDLAVANSHFSEIDRIIGQHTADVDDIQEKIGVNIVYKKFKSWTSKQRFIELSTRVYIMDDGWRKQNKPFVKSDENGVTDEYPADFGPGAVMRCYMLKRLVLVGYCDNDDLIAKGADRNNFEYLFGKSYRELVAYMREFNYEKLDEGISTINFYEI